MQPCLFIAGIAIIVAKFAAAQNGPPLYAVNSAASTSSNNAISAGPGALGNGNRPNRPHRPPGQNGRPPSFLRPVGPNGKPSGASDQNETTVKPGGPSGPIATGPSGLPSPYQTHQKPVKPSESDHSGLNGIPPASVGLNGQNGRPPPPGHFSQNGTVSGRPASPAGLEHSWPSGGPSGFNDRNQTSQQQSSSLGSYHNSSLTHNEPNGGPLGPFSQHANGVPDSSPRPGFNGPNGKPPGSYRPNGPTGRPPGFSPQNENSVRPEVSVYNGVSGRPTGPFGPNGRPDLSGRNETNGRPARPSRPNSNGANEKPPGPVSHNEVTGKPVAHVDKPSAFGGKPPGVFSAYGAQYNMPGRLGSRFGKSSESLPNTKGHASVFPSAFPRVILKKILQQKPVKVVLGRRFKLSFQQKGSESGSSSDESRGSDNGSRKGSSSESQESKDALPVVEPVIMVAGSLQTDKPFASGNVESVSVPSFILISPQTVPPPKGGNEQLVPSTRPEFSTTTTSTTSTPEPVPDRMI